MSVDSRLLLNLALEVNVPVLLWGSPGTAKTSIINEDARRRKWHVETLIGSILDPTDISGLPIADLGSRVAKRLLPDFFVRLQNKGGILFLDELSCAPPAVQAGLLRLVAERSIGDEILPPEVRMVAAANPTEQAAGGWTLAPPMANRFVHIDWTLDTQSWINWIRSSHSQELPDIPPTDNAWEQALPKATALVTGFLAAKTSLLLKVPKSDEEAGKAWPSPRSWEMATKLLAVCDWHGLKEEVSLILVGGAVSPQTSIELMQWIKSADLPNPEDILKDPDGVPIPHRDDVAFSALASLVDALARDLTNERWRAGWRYVDRIIEARGPDVCGAAIVGLSKVWSLNKGKMKLKIPKEVGKILPLMRSFGFIANPEE